jgi:hypothetical protein
MAKTIDFFFDVYNSRFEVGYHRIFDGRIRQRLINFFLEDPSSFFEDRYVGLQHEALRLDSLKLLNQLLAWLQAFGCG